MAKGRCDLKYCSNPIGEGASKIGFRMEDGKRIKEVRVCAPHTYRIMCAPRGTFHLTDDCELTKKPSNPLIIDLKEKK